MHLKRIEQTNYRQYRQLDVDFSGNLIALNGVKGRTERNKESALSESLNHWWMNVQSVT